MWDLPGPGLKPMYPALAGGFFTTVPPGKPLPYVFYQSLTDLGEGKYPTPAPSRLPISPKETNKIVFKMQAWGFPGGAVVENLPANAGDKGSGPGLGGSHMPRSN